VAASNGEALAADLADDPVLRDFLAPITISTSGSIEETIARANGKTVTIQHDDGSSRIGSVMIGDRPVI
jgi:hypothetical protein